MTDKAEKHLDSGKNLRAKVALNASYEISAIVNMLQREQVADTSEFYLLLPSMLRRIYALNGVVMSVVGTDDGREIEEMQDLVCGRGPLEPA